MVLAKAATKRKDKNFIIFKENFFMPNMNKFKKIIFTLNVRKVKKKRECKLAEKVDYPS